MDFDFGPMMDARIRPYTIGILYAGSDSARPLGSGTLIKTKAVQGMLTCAHALVEIEKQKEIGIVQFPTPSGKLQQLKIDVSTIKGTALKFYNGCTSEDGPDLAFVPLPPHLMSSLSAASSVCDMEIGGDRFAAGEPQDTQSFVVVAGVVGELTPPMRELSGKKVLNVEGLMNVGQVICDHKADELDLLTFEPIPEQGFVLPDNYEGVSGGGIWRVYVRCKEDNQFEHVETRLTGVAFWQTSPPNPLIIGHGHKSIYGNLLDAINQRWK